MNLSGCCSVVAAVTGHIEIVMNLAGCCSVVAQPGACLQSACHVCIDVGPDVLYRLCILREVGKIETKITQTEAFASTPLSFVFFLRSPSYCAAWKEKLSSLLRRYKSSALARSLRLSS